jgi:hypothetical protein
MVRPEDVDDPLGELLADSFEVGEAVIGSGDLLL